MAEDFNKLNLGPGEKSQFRERITLIFGIGREKRDFFLRNISSRKELWIEPARLSREKSSG